MLIFHTQQQQPQNPTEQTPHRTHTENLSLVEPNMVLSLWKNQSSDIKLVDFCTSGVLDLVEILEGLGSGALKLELGIS
jgi:hypothetical protein